MRRASVVLLLIFLTHVLQAQRAYWQQQVNYIIDVRLNDRDKSIDGFEKITYINNSPDTLTYIWFHLWPNAYKNDRTAFSEHLLENGNTRFYFSDKNEKGYINRLDFKVNGVTAKTEDHPEHIDIVKVVLPAPLPPRGQATITTPFHEQLPFNFSRGGYDGQSFQLTQWYPKPAVYDQKGWHPMPYLDQGEFYSEFGNFDVRITLPKNYVVAATGVLQNAEELEWLNSRKLPAKPLSKLPARKMPPGKVQPKKPAVSEPVVLKTLQYKQDSVHDFAWFANKDFVVERDSVLISGKAVDLFVYYTPAEARHWKSVLKYAKDGLQFYSDQVGAYPFRTASVVQGPASFGGGMEYPTITIISPMKSDHDLDLTVAHELGHNWFYGILGSNERNHPWMDEGLNTFYENKYGRQKYGATPQWQRIGLLSREIRKRDQPVNTPAAKLDVYNYGQEEYIKTADWLAWIESMIGKSAFRERMQSYYEQWRFRHPQPEDLKAVFQSSLKDQTENVFSKLDTTGMLPNEQLTGFKWYTTLKPSGIRSYLTNPVKDALLLSPAIGFNAYDGFMAGALITNYKLPPNKFQFFAAGLYGSGSSRLNGIGKISYSFYPKHVFRLGQLFVNGSTFSMDEFKDSADRKIYLAFQKLVPGFRLTFKEKDPRSTIRKYIQWKTFLITEQGLNIKRDTVIRGPSDTALVLRYNKQKQSYAINQLQFVLDNSRALYPYTVKLQIDQNADFIRPTLDLDYFFNYRKGGLALRFFAGKFLYLGEKTLSKQFATDRFHLNMTGANGYEDYTYSNYFLGRNKFEGLSSQQIMIRDGGFKVRTDLLAEKVAKTDDWLIALNLNTTVPDNLNPLNALPFKIPLHLFADIGTYAEGWDRTQDKDRFLFDAGLHVPLFKGIVNVYIPVLYSKVYRDYFKSTIPENRFLKTISFTIDLNTEWLKHYNREAEF